MSNILVYELDKKIYINLTNRCTNECIFCLRQDKDDVCGQELWLDSEDFTSEDVIEQLKKFNLSSEVIFCGYGEPMLKFEVLRQVAKYIKETYPEIKIRVNTNGHANFIYKKNVVPELVGLVDEFSVSLNASNSEEYDELSQPKFENAYEEVKKFIKCSADAGIETVASIVDGYKGRRLDVEKCREIAESLGAKLRVREWIVNGYS
ncbi:MAG TPA: radical SAM protein [Cyanobacteria bacterium UBA10660]|nr:radical SAM domain protein [Clostridium sp. CAG:813]DAA81239.1 MAG TPA: radical SAM protein [Candidatus Gastranaerophilales bacterium HUM_1]HAS93238.1 radical SAM protein [Cyanobacteria bacterium UBA10660]